jgi:hypothetical protein
VDNKKGKKKVEWTAEDRARHKAIRERFANKPSVEQVLASGEYSDPIPTGEYFSLRQAVGALKRAREAAGLSLAEVEERSGVDKGALCRLETGQNVNPTANTLIRYAQALGKRWVWRLEDAERTEAQEGAAGESTDLSPTDSSKAEK